MGVCSTTLKTKENKEKQTGNYMQMHIFEVMISAFLFFCGLLKISTPYAVKLYLHIQ